MSLGSVVAIGCRRVRRKPGLVPKQRTGRGKVRQALRICVGQALMAARFYAAMLYSEWVLRREDSQEWLSY